MRATEEQRRALFDRVRAHLDEETAALLLAFAVLEGRLTERFAGVEERLTGVEAQVKALGTELLGRISWVVIPLLAAVNLVLVGLATWIGTLVG